jgi:hypothetical protein
MVSAAVLRLCSRHLCAFASQHLIRSDPDLICSHVIYLQADAKYRLESAQRRAAARENVREVQTAANNAAEQAKEVASNVAHKVRRKLVGNSSVKQQPAHLQLQ